MAETNCVSRKGSTGRPATSTVQEDDDDDARVAADLEKMVSAMPSPIRIAVLYKVI